MEIIAAAFRLAIVLGIVGVIAFVAVSFGMAMNLLQPPRMGAGKALYFLRRLGPQDIGLPYETLTFPVRDQRTGKILNIASWWIENSEPSGRTAIVIHGFSDAKVGGIAWAPLLRSLGFHVLAVDLRAHGDSQGRFSTAAFYERYDVSQVIDQIKASHPDQTRRIVLFGVSLGAAVALATSLLRQDLSALILESPYVDFTSAVLNHAQKLPLPGRSFQRLALWFFPKIGHLDFRAVRPVEMIAKAPCPVWLIQSGCDPFVKTSEQAALEKALASRPANLGISQIWNVENCHHVIALSEHPEEFRRRLCDFLDAALAATPVV